MSRLPGDNPDTTSFDESPVFGNHLPNGATVAMKCTQGLPAVTCDDGPAIKSTQSLTFIRSASQLNLQNPIAGLPTPPFKIQVAGTSSNDGIHTVLGVDVTGLVLSLAQRPQNETKLATVALASSKLQFTDKQGNLGQGQAYLRHFTDSLQCFTPTGLPTVCEDGVAFVDGIFYVQIKCANSGPNLMLPCEFSSFVGDGSSGTFSSPAGMNNFSACQGTTNLPCELFWSDAAKNCKDFPKTAEFAECQTLKVTLQTDKTFGKFFNRTLNTIMSPDGESTKLAFKNDTNVPVGNPVTIEASPDPLNAAQNGTLSVKIVNDGKVNLANIVLNTIQLTFADFRTGAGGFTSVLASDTPTGCDPSGNCFVSKFIRGCVLNAYLEAKFADPIGHDIPSGTPILLTLAARTNAGGEVVGQQTITTNQTFLYGSLTCPD